MSADEFFVIYRKEGSQKYVEFFDNNDLDSHEGVIVQKREIQLPNKKQ